ncbi:MAG TPA: iron-sulfur cluster assembly protein [Ignavibacteria bacterium]
MEETKKSEAQKDNTVQAHSTEEIKEEVMKVLRTCYDPEIPVNIVDLGLIYDIKIATNGDVFVVMTLTSPACPVAGILPPEVQQKLKDRPMIHDARVEITFDPPWSPDRMSEEAKLELGFL